MHLYREFTRSIRVGDIGTDIECMRKLSRTIQSIQGGLCNIIILCYYLKKFILWHPSVEKICNRKLKNESYQKRRETLRDMPDTRPLWQYFVYFIGAKSRYGRSYPLTPALLSLSHVDGTMLKTDKSKLYKVLELKTRCEIPVVDETVIDASFSPYLYAAPP